MSNSRRIEEDTINDTRVIVQQLPAMKGFRLMARVGKVLGPAIADLSGTTKLEDDIGPLLSTLFSSADPDEFAKIVVEALSCAKVSYVNSKGQDTMRDLTNEGAINLAFGGDIGTMLKVLVFALKVNFGDFFSAVAATPALTAAAMDKSE